MTASLVQPKMLGGKPPTMPSAQNAPAYRPVRAPRGAALSCKGWQQEAVLRMLLNSLDPDVAERPQELVISGATGKVAANWESCQAIIASLRQLEGEESLHVEAGTLAGMAASGAPRSARVLVTNTPDDETFGNWLYAGTQTELPVLYEVYAAVAHSYLGRTLAGKLVIGGGMGGAGGAQALAAALHGAAFLGIDADAERIKRRVKTGYCEVMVTNLDEALRMLKNAIRQSKSASIGLLGNCADIWPELALRGVVPDLIADYTPTEAPFDAYIPAGSIPDEAAAARRANAKGFGSRIQESMAIQHAGLQSLQRLGARAITSSDVRCILQLLLDDGWRVTTWLALSGEPADIARLDRLALEIFRDDERIQNWLPIAGKYIRFQGLPARVAWLKLPNLGEFARSVNDLVARSEVSAPILLGCRLTSADLVAAESIENCVSWVWRSPTVKPVSPNQFSARAVVADGTTDAAKRLSRWTGA